MAAMGLCGGGIIQGQRQIPREEIWRDEVETAQAGRGPLAEPQSLARYPDLLGGGSRDIKVGRRGDEEVGNARLDRAKPRKRARRKTNA